MKPSIVRIDLEEAEVPRDGAQPACPPRIVLEGRQFFVGRRCAEKSVPSYLSYPVSSCAYLANDLRLTSSPRPACPMPVRTILSAFGFSCSHASCSGTVVVGAK